VARRYRPFSLPFVVVGLLALAFTASATSLNKHEWAETPAVVGRLAAVDLAARSVTVSPDDVANESGVSASSVELDLDADSELWQESGRLSTRVLATQAGARVKVRYRFAGSRRVVRSVTVERLRVK
jgi:hypothetical protein